MRLKLSELDALAKRKVFEIVRLNHHRGFVCLLLPLRLAQRLARGRSAEHPAHCFRG